MLQATGNSRKNNNSVENTKYKIKVDLIYLHFIQRTIEKI